MRRCVRMTSNSGSGSGSGNGSAPNGRMTRDPSSSSLSTYIGDAYGSATDSDGQRSHSNDSEQALFWAAVSGCLAMSGNDKEATGADGQRNFGRDDEVLTRGTTSVRDSSSASPRESSPTHSNESDDFRGGSYRRMHADHDYPHGYAGAGRPPLTQQNGTGADSFCCKLASVLASDNRLSAKPIALRALQNAGIVDPSVSTSSALAGPSLASHLLDPQHSSILAAHLVAVAGPAAASTANATSPGSLKHGILGLQRERDPSPSFGMSSRSSLRGVGYGFGDGAHLAPSPRHGPLGGMHCEPRVTREDVDERRVHQLLSLVAQREFMAARGMTMPGQDHMRPPLQHTVMPRVVESGHKGQA